MAKIRLTFIGHASFRFESEQGTQVYFDPWLDENPMSSLRVADVERADVIIASHGHNDHVGDSFRLCERTGAPFVGNYELCLVAQKHGLVLGENALPLNPGGTVRVADAQITMTQAHHSQSTSAKLVLGPAPEGLYYHPDGTTGGFVIRFDNGIAVYDTSDTCVFGDMGLIGEMYGPQIAIMPVGGKFTMGIREAARAVGLIRPDVVIPCHAAASMGQEADLAEFVRAVEFLCPRTRVALMEPGQTLEYVASSHHLLS